MTGRLNVETIEHYQGEPVWIRSSFEVTAGRDPLGIQTITTDRIMPQLVPGLLALSRRPRYLSSYPLLLGEYQHTVGMPWDTGLVRPRLTASSDENIAIPMRPAVRYHVSTGYGRP